MERPGVALGDVHLHVPAGAVPKDGPSACVTMAAGLVSELTGRTVRVDVAMTSEITLTIGGIRDKVLAARRDGVVQVVLSSRTRAGSRMLSATT